LFHKIFRKKIYNNLLYSNKLFHKIFRKKIYNNLLSYNKLFHKIFRKKIYEDTSKVALALSDETICFFLPGYNIIPPFPPFPLTVSSLIYIF